MRAKMQGIVRLEGVVLPDGTVGDVKVTRSLDAVFAWIWKPSRPPSSSASFPARGSASPWPSLSASRSNSRSLTRSRSLFNHEGRGLKRLRGFDSLRFMRIFATISGLVLLVSVASAQSGATASATINDAMGKTIGTATLRETNAAC